MNPPVAITWLQQLLIHSDFEFEWHFPGRVYHVLVALAIYRLLLLGHICALTKGKKGEMKY